jgi:hypothetical protein
LYLGASLLTGIAAGAAVGGWGLLAGLVLAGVFAAVAGGIAHPVLRAIVLLALGVLAARAFGEYLVPVSPGLAAAVLVVLATGAAAAGADVSATGRRLLAVVLLLAAASFTAICFGIEPPAPVEGAPKATFGAAGLGPFGVLAAAGLFAAPLMVLVPGPRTRRLARIAVGVLAAVAVAAGALHQLGPVRLGLSDVPLRDALAAADAAALSTMLSAAVVLVTLPAVLAAMAAGLRAVDHLGKPTPRVLAVGGGAAVAAALLPSAAALAAASTVAITATIFAALRPKPSTRTSE